MRTPEQRAYSTEYARRRRAAQLLEANRLATVCQALLANKRPCKTRLQSVFVNGETLPFCPTCDRKARGCCITCEAPVCGPARWSLYCVLHTRLAKQEAAARHRARHAKRRAKRERARVVDPVKYADRLEYKKLWRQAMPSKVAAAKKRYAAQNAEKVKAYHEAYRARKKAERAAVERARYHDTPPPRTCLTCPTVLTGRAKKCDACKQGERRAARARIAERLAALEQAT